MTAARSASDAAGIRGGEQIRHPDLPEDSANGESMNKLPDHSACSECQRELAVYALTDGGQPLCRLCTSRAGVERGAAFRRNYWKRCLSATAEKFRARMQQHWVQSIFDDFVNEQMSRHDLRHAIKRLPVHAAFFARMDAQFSSPDALTMQSVLQKVSAKQINQSIPAIAYLRDRGYETPTRAVIADTRERLGIRHIISSARGEHARVLELYREHMTARSLQGQTLRTEIRFAARVLKLIGPDGLTDAFLRKYQAEFRGQRSRLLRFVKFLRSRNLLDSKSMLAGVRATTRIQRRRMGRTIVRNPQKKRWPASPALGNPVRL